MQYKKATTNSICNLIYSFVIFYYNLAHLSIAIAEVTAGLYEACQEEIKNRREEFMVVYRNVAHPDPLDRVAEAFEEIASGIKSLSDPDMLVEIAKKAGLTGKEPERNVDWKPKTEE